MKQKFWIPILVLGIFFAVKSHLQRAEIRRLEHNLHALRTEIDLTRNRLGEATAACEVIELRYKELRSLDSANIRRLKALRIRLHRAESMATAATEQLTRFRAPILAKDTIIRHDTIVRHDTLRVFRWRDRWVAVDGTISQDSVDCKVRSIDTLRQVVHRIPRRFLFFRFGTKAIRQEISSSNPHTRIVYTEYIKLKR